MSNIEKYVVTDLRKMSFTISFSLLLFAAFLAACSTPTVSNDDSEEKSSSEKVVKDSVLSSSKGENLSSSSKGGNLSSSSNMNSDDESSLPSAESTTIPCKTETEDNCEYGELIDERDGKKYKTVKIGYRWWMAENLNYADSVKTPSLLNSSWCFNNEPDSCSKYGRLYTWAAAIDSVKLYRDKSIVCGDGENCSLPDTVYGICPSGWHLPTDGEWNILFDEIGGEGNAGKVLKSQSGWYEDGNGTDGVGFSALPAGDRWESDGDNFDGDGITARFWSDTPRSGWDAYYVSIVFGADTVYMSDRNKDYGFSVRCVKSASSPLSRFRDPRDGRVYTAVSIGSQTWMAENLNYETENSWCGGGNDTMEGDCATYGRLYTWASAMGKREDECGRGYECNLGESNVQGICPDGWHIPKKEDWLLLISNVGGHYKDFAAKLLKSRSGWKSECNGTDAYGFSALPAGYMFYKGYFYGNDKEANFWTDAVENDGGDKAYFMSLNCSNTGLGSYSKDYGISVRCLKD